MAGPGSRETDFGGEIRGGLGGGRRLFPYFKACGVCVSYLAIAERRFTGHVVNFICRDMDEPYEIVCEAERYGD